MIKIRCCVGSSCHIRGGAKTLKILKSLIAQHNLDDQVEIAADLCLDNCIRAPNVVIDGEIFGGVTPDKAEAFFEKHILERVGK